MNIWQTILRRSASLKTLLLELTILISLDCLTFGFITENAKPKQEVDASDSGLKFLGNNTKNNHFKLLKRDGEFLLIGAQNTVYNISAVDFASQRHIFWSPTIDDVQNCFMNGKSEDECHNYIRVLAKDSSDGNLVVCGTNAFRPACRLYSPGEDGLYNRFEKFEGVGLVPYDPTHNSSAVYVPETKELYAGTVAQFDGTDPVILRRKINSADFGMRTERYDTKVLNEPNFMRSFADQKHVYFWFRETAVEYTNCGKTVLSRVARVCKNDKGGGPRGNNDSWTTFLKARLNCSVPGEFPFYFDQLEAASEMVSGDYGQLGSSTLVYAIFNTPFEAVKMSAVCAFSMDAIRTTFATSAFKSQSSTASYCTPTTQRSDDPRTRPGNCDIDTQEVPVDVINFMKKNPLMDQAVANFFNSPFLVNTGKRTRFTQIAVDPQVLTVDGLRCDVLYVGTEDGKILKAVNIPDEKFASASLTLIANINIFAKPQPVKNLLVYRSPSPNATKETSLQRAIVKRLIVVTDDEVRGLPLHHCNLARSCSACVQLQDPHCAWDLKQGLCVGKDDSDWTNGVYLQNVKTGASPKCATAGDDVTSSRVSDHPDFKAGNVTAIKEKYILLPTGTPNSNDFFDNGGKPGCNCGDSTKKDPNRTNVPREARLVDNSADFHHDSSAQSESGSPTTNRISELPSATRPIYSAEALAVAVVVTLIVSCLAGFCAGYKFSSSRALKQKFLPWSTFTTLRKNSDASSTKQHQPNLGKSVGKLSNHIDAFAYQPSPPKFNDPVSLVLTLDDPKIDKYSKNSSNENFATLPKDYKVKKMYL